MKRVLIVAAALLMAGCAVKPLKYDVAALQQSEAIVVSDLRPASEKEQKIFSLMLTNDAYGINRNGEQVIDPTPLRLFKHRVHEKYAGGTQPSKVVVHHFVSYTNAAASLKKVAVASVFGAVGALAASATNNKSAEEGVTFINPSFFDSTSSTEFKRALYTPEENPQKANVFVIYLDAEIDGKRQTVRKIAPVIAKDKTSGKHPYVEAVDSTIRAFLASY